MKTLQFAALCAACFAGCLVGSWLALRPTVTALAQIRPVDPSLQPRTDDKLFIPNGGLPIVGANNRPLGFISATANGASLTLLASNGRPGVRLEAGSAGMVTLGASGQEAGLAVTTDRGARLSSLVSSSGIRQEFVQGERTLKLELGADASLSIPGRGNDPVFEVKGLVDGASLQMRSRQGTELINLSTNLDQGTASLSSIKEKTRLLFTGRGEASAVKEGKTLWTASSLLGEGQRTADGPAALPPGSTGGGY